MCFKSRDQSGETIFVIAENSTVVELYTNREFVTAPRTRVPYQLYSAIGAHLFAFFILPVIFRFSI